MEGGVETCTRGPGSQGLLKVLRVVTDSHPDNACTQGRHPRQPSPLFPSTSRPRNSEVPSLGPPTFPSSPMSRRQGRHAVPTEVGVLVPKRTRDTMFIPVTPTLFVEL